MASPRDLTRCLSSSASNKKRYRNTVLLLAVVAALLSVLGLGVALHKLRAGRALALRLQDGERQLLTLHMVLEKERARSNQMKAKIQELKAKAASLRTQKVQLKAKLTEVQTQAAHLMQKLASLQDAAEEASAKADLRVAALTDQLKQQEEEQQEEQQRRPDHDAEEVEPRPQQPDANATSLNIPHDDDDGGGGVSSNGNITDQGADNHDQSTAGEEEIKKINAPADRGDDHDQTTTPTTGTDTGTGTGAGAGAGADTGGSGGDQGGGEYSEKQEEQGSEGGKWVRLETNVDDGARESAGNGDGGSVGGEDRGKEAGEHQVGELVAAPEGEQGREVLLVGDQSGVPGDGEQASQATAGATDQLRLDNSMTSGGATTTGAEDVTVAIRDDVVESSNTTEIITTSSSVTAASTEEKQATAETQISIRGKRSRRTTRGKGRRRKEAAAGSSEQPNPEVLLESSSISSRKEISFQHGDADGDGGQSSGEGGHEIINAADGRPVLDDKNAAAEMANGVLLWPKVQGRQVQTDAAEEQTRGTTVGGGGGGGLELASVSSTADDPDTNGSGLMKGTADAGDDEVGVDGGEREEISSGTTEGSNTSEGAPEAREENINIRSATEAGEDLVAAAHALPL